MINTDILTVAVCEDMETELHWLAKQLADWGRENNKKLVIREYQDAAQFWFHYETEKPDAVFLDIKMPGEDGVSMAKRLRQLGDQTAIVFVTGEGEYIAEGYEVEAVHYLLKPVRKEKIYACMERICERLGAAEPFVLLRTNDMAVRLLQKDIYKIEAFGHKVVYTARQGSYEINAVLKNVWKTLYADWFVECHRGIIVGIGHIERIERNRLILDFPEERKESAEVPVSRRLYDAVNQKFISYYGVKNGRKQDG